MDPSSGVNKDFSIRDPHILPPKPKSVRFSDIVFEIHDSWMKISMGLNPSSKIHFDPCVMPRRVAKGGLRNHGPSDVNPEVPHEVFFSGQCPVQSVGGGWTCEKNGEGDLPNSPDSLGECRAESSNKPRGETPVFIVCQGNVCGESHGDEGRGKDSLTSDSSSTLFSESLVDSPVCVANVSSEGNGPVKRTLFFDDFRSNDAISPVAVSPEGGLSQDCIDVRNTSVMAISATGKSECLGGKISQVPDLSSPPDENKLRMLDLFSGTGSVGRKFIEQGYDVMSVDFRRSEHPSVCVDVLKWKYREFPPGYFDVIAAGPPCGDYSLAKNFRPRRFHRADRLVRKTVEIIQYFKPRLWWIENPRTGFLKTRNVIKNFPFIDVDYCQFSDWGYQKPTRIWCCPQIARLPNRVCDWATCPNLVVGSSGMMRHKERLGGPAMRFSPRMKGRMPGALVDYLMSSVKNECSQCDFTVEESGVDTHKETLGEGRTVFVPSRCFLVDQKRIFSVEQDLQLMMPILVGLPNGVQKLMNVLVDTGAQVNLIRSGLVEPGLMDVAVEPVRLLAANNQVIEGGDKVVPLSLGFMQFQGGEWKPDLLVLEGIFFQAAIEVDMILSYPWLLENKLGVFPHHNSLALDEPELTLLYGWRGANERNNRGKKSRFWPNRIHAVGVQGNQHELLDGSQSTRIPHNFPSPERCSSLDFDEVQGEVWKLRLHLPAQGLGERETPLKSSDVKCMVRNLQKNAEPKAVSLIIRSHEGQGVEDPRVEEYRAKIIEDYGGVVLASEVKPDPPIRGPYGQAYIPLKENAVPTRSKPFRLHGEKHEAMCEVARQWLDRKFIEPVPRGIPVEWLSNTFPVPKKDGSWRGVVDIRGPNSQTRRVAYPLPVIEDLLVKQGANQIFSILDLKQAFHQQPLHPDSRPITCCNTPLGIFQWRVNVMGLTNASQQFQQMMEDRLFPVRDVADPYIDDILVGTKVGPGEDLLEAHDRDLRRVLDVLKKEELVADLKKVELFTPEVTFCGHILGGGTRRPAPGKLKAIEKWETPQTITELRAFLGFTNYYNVYIKDYSRIVARLQDKLKVPRSEGKKGSRKKISWDEEDEDAFQEIKRILCSQLALQRVNPDRPFVLRVDASKVAVGATLEQLLDEERAPTVEDVQHRRTVPVAFMSRKLTGSQRNWTPREQETYAIIVALQKWESWVGLQPVMVLTDHKSLESWAKEVLDTPSGPLGRRSRWHQILSKFDLSVGYIPGKENTVADILSRWAYPASQAMRDVSKHGTAQDKEEVDGLLHDEREEESTCVWLLRKGPPCIRNTWICGVTTRSGKKTETPEVAEASMHEGVGGVDIHGGTKPHGDAISQTPVEPTPLDPGLGLGGSDGGDDEDVDEAIELSAEPEISPTPIVELASHATPTSSTFPNVLTPTPKPAEVKFSEVWDVDWGHEYEKCPRWGPVYRAVRDGTADWPKDVKFFHRKILLKEAWCIPWTLQEPIIREYHTFLGHVGFSRLWKAMELKYAWADADSAKKFARGVMGQCESCQACQRPGDLHGILEPTPIPPAVMASVALDLFDMPMVEYEGSMFNMMVVCVDRHSGWIVAVPCKKQGLTGARVAKLMLAHQWRPFGVPSIVTCDRGSHFVSEWWQTMCALMGIRVAFSHSYFHHTNGRAEKAGQQIIDRMRKIQVDTKMTWVELLPQVLDRLHDTPGEGGLSPYQILFGRDRPLGGIPYQPPHECEDATDFFNRMREVDEVVAFRLNGVHAKQMARANASRRKGPNFQVGDKVWYLRPPESGNKLDSRWIGPTLIVAREGERSYVVETKPGHRVGALQRALKLHVPDTHGGEPIPLYYHQRTVVDPDAEPDEWRVDKILSHREAADGSGLQFKTKWEGSDRVTWEPVGNFFSKYNSDFVAYCQNHNLLNDLTKYLSPTPTTE